MVVGVPQKVLLRGIAPTGRRWFPGSHDGSAQGSGATTDIEPSLLDRNGEPVEKFGCGQAAPPTDVGLIGVPVCPYVTHRNMLPTARSTEVLEIREGASSLCVVGRRASPGCARLVLGR